MVVFVSGASQRLGSRISKFFRQNTTPERAWRFFDKKFEFLIPSLPLPHATKMTPDAVWMAAWKQRHTHREAERKRDRCIGVQRHVDGLRAVLQIRGKLAFRPPCGSHVTVIVMRAWLAVTGVPPVVHCRKTGLSAVALSAMEGKLVLRHGAL